MNAFLSIKNYNLPINSFEDILDSPMELLIYGGTSTEDLFRSSHPDSVYGRIYKAKLLDKDRIEDKGGDDEAFQLVKKGRAMITGGLSEPMLRPEYPCRIVDVKALRY